MIITIAGQYGSGGFEAAHIVAEKLGYRLFDKDLIEKVTSKADREASASYYDEDQPASATGGYKNATLDLQLDCLPVGQNIRARQQSAAAGGAMIDNLRATILEEAEAGNVIFLGRGAGYFLKDREDLIGIFTRDDIENRVNRISKLYNVDAAEAKKLIDMTDKRRSEFCSIVTGGIWGSSANYDLVVDVNGIGGEEKLAALIEYLVANA